MGKCKCVNCDCNVINAEKVSAVKKQMQEEEVLLAMADFYKALCDSTRIKIINALDCQELCVSDICSLLNMSKSAVSHQLQNLKEQGLVKCRKSGKEGYYSLADDHVCRVFEISLEHVLEENNEKKR